VLAQQKNSEHVTCSPWAIARIRFSTARPRDFWKIRAIFHIFITRYRRSTSVVAVVFRSINVSLCSHYVMRRTELSEHQRGDSRSGNVLLARDIVCLLQRSEASRSICAIHLLLLDRNRTTLYFAKSAGSEPCSRSSADCARKFLHRGDRPAQRSESLMIGDSSLTRGYRRKDPETHRQ